MHPKDADGMANSVDPEQTSRSSLIWVYTVCLDLPFRKLWIIMVMKLLLLGFEIKLLKTTGIYRNGSYCIIQSATHVLLMSLDVERVKMKIGQNY